MLVRETESVRLPFLIFVCAYTFPCTEMLLASLPLASFLLSLLRSIANSDSIKISSGSAC